MFFSMMLYELIALCRHALYTAIWVSRWTKTMTISLVCCSHPTSWYSINIFTYIYAAVIYKLLQIMVNVAMWIFFFTFYCLSRETLSIDFRGPKISDKSLVCYSIFHWQMPFLRFYAIWSYHFCFRHATNRCIWWSDTQMVCYWISLSSSPRGVLGLLCALFVNGTCHEIANSLRRCDATTMMIKQLWCLTSRQVIKDLGTKSRYKR
jgi:hypothetical protein